jgi:hypothetical protein
MQMLRNQQIAQQGQQFGVFAPLYQAGLKFGDVGAQAAMQGLFPQQADPRLQQATAVQSVLAKYQGEDLTDPAVLAKIGKELTPIAPEAGFKALTLADQRKSAQTERQLAERRLTIAEQEAQDRRYTNNPELLLSDGLALPEGDPKRDALLTRYSRIAGDRNFSIAKQEADLKKASAELAKTIAETERIRTVTASEARDAEGNRVNNNGQPVGTFDKVGRYKAPGGRVMSPKAYETALSEHDAASDLVFRLERLTDDDIKNAYGSALDYTTTLGGGVISSNKTYNAQTKINEVGIRNVLNNLQNLKGPSSDKEMAQMIKDFPGYQASPDVMRAWVNRAVEATNRFLERSEKRYGFDTDYGTKNRFTVGSRTEKQSKTQTPSTGSTWRILD